MIAYKFLLRDRVAPFSGQIWPKEAWLAAEGPLLPCRNGVHGCRLDDLPYWLEDELWEVELDGEILVEELKVVARRGRLIRQIEAWDEQTGRVFAEVCLRRVAMHAADELRDAGLADEAARLQAAESLDQVALAARRAVETANAAGAAGAARLAGYAEDAVGWTTSVPPSGVAYVAAHAADARSRANTADAFATERSVQARWLADRLSLS